MQTTSDSMEVLALVADEMDKQLWKWGEQNHPLIDSPAVSMVRKHFAREAALEKWSNDLLVQQGKLDWRGILLEEVYEALECDNADDAIAELAQVAAVAASAILSINRSGLGGKR